MPNVATVIRNMHRVGISPEQIADYLVIAHDLTTEAACNLTTQALVSVAH